MTFTPIDLQTWTRGQVFYYFSKMAPTGYSLTVDLDVTALRQTLRKEGLKLFPAYLWLVTKHLNQQIEFKIAEQDSVLGYFDTLTPLYASFHEDDKTFSLMWTDFHPDFSAFYASYLEHQTKYAGNHGILTQPQTPPPANSYTVSCIPWVSFSHFAVHSYENKPYYFPSVESGKLFKREEKTWMPLSITCHHATTDGYHVHRFLEAVQADMDSFVQFL
ncbi:MAG: CatA-like O-acetyltransferase [Lawsonibacter sp.]